jgi:hypothetical protein
MMKQGGPDSYENMITPRNVSTIIMPQYNSVLKQSMEKMERVDEADEDGFHAADGGFGEERKAQ